MTHELQNVIWNKNNCKFWCLLLLLLFCCCCFFVLFFCFVFYLVLFFAIAARKGGLEKCVWLRVLFARWRWPSFPIPPCWRRVWCVAGLPLATRLFLLSAEAGISAVYVRPSGLQDRSCGLVMVPASFSWTCGHWVGCGHCVVSPPQLNATVRLVLRSRFGCVA